MKKIVSNCLLGVLYLECIGSPKMMRGLLAHFRATLPFLKPIRVIIFAFGVTGYLIYKLPISGIKAIV